MSNENSAKKDMENRFRNAKRDIDDLCTAYYGMTWEEYTRLLCGKEDKQRTGASQPGQKEENT